MQLPEKNVKLNSLDLKIQPRRLNMKDLKKYLMACVILVLLFSSFCGKSEEQVREERRLKVTQILNIPENFQPKYQILSDKEVSNIKLGYYIGERSIMCRIPVNLPKDEIEKNLKHVVKSTWYKYDDVIGVLVFFIRMDRKVEPGVFDARCMFGPNGNPYDATAESPIDTYKAVIDIYDKYYTDQTVKRDEREIYYEEMVRKYQNYAVQYRVTGSCETANISYLNSQGGVEQISNAKLPFFMGFNAPVDTPLSLTAQNDCDSGEIVVEIYKKGVLYKKSKSVGAFVVASADGVL